MKKLVIILAAFLLGTFLWGQPDPYELIYWDFENTLEPEYVDDYIAEVSDIMTDESTTIRFKLGTDGGNSRVGYIADTLFTTSEGFSPANPPEKYIEFSFRPRWNYAVHLTSMEFRFGRNQLGPRAVVGQISLDGFQTASDPFWVANPIESENENSLDFFRVNFQGAIRYRDANYKLTVRLYPIAAIEDQWDIVDPDDEDTWHTLMMNNFRVNGFIVPFPAITMLLDRSGSMGTDNFGLGYWNGARSRISAFTEHVIQDLDAMSLVTFNVEDMESDDYEDHAEAVIPMLWPNNKISQIWERNTTPDTVVTREFILNEIDDLDDPIGRTSIGSGLLVALDQKEDIYGRKPGKAAIILLSDGFDNWAPFARTVVPDIPDSIDVFCIALGTVADDALLAWIAAQTGGLYVNATTVQHLMGLYLEIYYRGVQQLQNHYSDSRTIAANSRQVHDIIVDDNSGQVKFLFVRYTEETSNDVTPIGFTLTSPSGKVINPATAQQVSGITYREGFTGKMYDLLLPEKGVWQATVSGNNIQEEEEYLIAVYGASELRLSFTINEDEYIVNDQVVFTANIKEGNEPVRSATVTAWVTPPEDDTRNRSYSDPEDTPFADYEPENRVSRRFERTRNPDPIEVVLTETEAGVYRGVFSDTEFAGPYNVSVIASAENDDYHFNRQSRHSFVVSPPEEIHPPYLAAPADGSTDLPISVRFVWSNVDRAESYHFQLAGRNEILVDLQGIENNYLVVDSLDYQTDYTWRVKAMSGTDESFWSAIWGFRTGVPEIPIPSNLDGSIVYEGVLLDWEEVPLEHHFYGDLYGYLVYRNDILHGYVTPAFTHHTDRHAIAGNTYTYYVKSVYDLVSQWTSGPSNRVEIMVTGIDGEEVPLVTGIAGNYPNPFNPETTISFAVDKPSFTEITVYNIIGQKVRTLVKETLERGNHSVIWDARDEAGRPVTSGVYMLKMETDNYVGHRKVLLLK